MNTKVSHGHEMFELSADDGCRIAVSRFNAQKQFLGNLVVAGATGVPQEFYYNFARYASACGYNINLGLQRDRKIKTSNFSWFSSDFS